jgi:hypothetical protein
MPDNRRLVMGMNGGYTPKTAALDIALGYLKLVYDGRTSDINDYATSNSDKLKVKIAVAKLHNKLLDDSGLDGMFLDVEVTA